MHQIKACFGLFFVFVTKTKQNKNANLLINDRDLIFYAVGPGTVGPFGLLRPMSKPPPLPWAGPGPKNILRPY